MRVRGVVNVGDEEKVSGKVASACVCWLSMLSMVPEVVAWAGELRTER